jgi:hypothetical protein
MQEQRQGRLSEVLNNPALLNYDRLQRRMGMVFAAENMLTEIAKDPFSQKGIGCLHCRRKRLHNYTYTKFNAS